MGIYFSRLASSDHHISLFRFFFFFFLSFFFLSALLVFTDNWKKEEMKVDEIGRVLVLFASIALMEGSLEVEHDDRKHHLEQDGLRLKDYGRKQWTVDELALGFTRKYSASSEWSGSYDAGHAVEGEGQYWCSKRGAKAPLYFWISFVEKPVEIVSITFEEKYPAATFEFFATNNTECGKTGTELINGTREEINQKTFENGGSYYCYGLRITKLGDGGKYGDLASLSKFRFKGNEENMRFCRNIRSNCESYVNFDRCDRNGLGFQFRDVDYKHILKWKRRCCDDPLEEETCWQTVSAFRKEKPSRCLEEDSDETRRYWDQWFGNDVLRWIATPPFNFSVVVCEDSAMSTTYCLNGGTCMQEKLSSNIMCFCAEGWMGKRCENRFIDLIGSGSTHARTDFEREASVQPGKFQEIIGSPCDCMSLYKKCETELRKAKEEKWPIDNYFLPRFAWNCCGIGGLNHKYCPKAKMKFDELSPASCLDYEKYLPEDDEVARHN